MQDHKFQAPADVRDFALAGNAILTLQSERTGSHYTYRVRQAKDRRTGDPQGLWFVSLLTGPDNEDSYTYLGLVRNGKFGLTTKSRLPEGAAPVAGFRYMWNNVQGDRMPPQMVIRHEGRCGRCARTLTVPESIDRGIGPECAKRVGG